jgi:hypothetical protein
MHIHRQFSAAGTLTRTQEAGVHRTIDFTTLTISMLFILQPKLISMGFLREDHTIHSVELSIL